jgi:Major Facilitator Superfamily
MIGALGLVRLQTRFRPENVMLGSLAALGCLMLTWPLAASLPVALALIALGGFADGPGLAATFGARQRWTPRELLGQIFTTAASLKVGAFAVGAACAGPAVNAFGARSTLLLAAAMQFTAVAVGLLLRRSRSGLDLQQDDRVDTERDRERDRPAVQVALDERPAAERARAGAADAERARQPAVLPRMQQHEEHEHDRDEDLQDREERVHGRRL